MNNRSSAVMLQCLHADDVTDDVNYIWLFSKLYLTHLQ